MFVNKSIRLVASRLINSQNVLGYNSGKMMYTVGSNLNTSSVTFKDQFGNSHQPSEIFDNKKVVVFGIPGDNPIDDFHQVPSFTKHADQIYKKGVDFIVCLSNADVPILRARSISLDPKRSLTHLSDVESKFAVENQLYTVDNSGEIATSSPKYQYKRFAMIVDNGKIVFENVESDIEK
eukprot:gene9046-11081_t